MGWLNYSRWSILGWPNELIKGDKNPLHFMYMLEAPTLNLDNEMNAVNFIYNRDDYILIIKNVSHE